MLLWLMPYNPWTILTKNHGGKEGRQLELWAAILTSAHKPIHWQNLGTGIALQPSKLFNIKHWQRQPCQRDSTFPKSPVCLINLGGGAKHRDGLTWRIRTHICSISASFRMGFNTLMKHISLCPLETTWIHNNDDFVEVVGKPVHSVQSVFPPLLCSLSLFLPFSLSLSLLIGKE